MRLAILCSSLFVHLSKQYRRHFCELKHPYLSRTILAAGASDTMNNKQIIEIGNSLLKEVLDKTGDDTIERCTEMLRSLEDIPQEKITITLLQETLIGKTLTKITRGCRRHKRIDSDKSWDSIIKKSEMLLSSWKSYAKESESQIVGAVEDSKVAGFPESIGTYRSRLMAQSKEMYKDPPAMPPPLVSNISYDCAIPERDGRTQELKFASSPASGSDVETAIREFRPNRTPEDILRFGSFGGTYFRPIHSAVTNVKYQSSDILKDTVDPEWIAGLNKSTLLTSMKYRKDINKYKVSCGGSLGMWESSGWISDLDPYGWFQWYCRFYRGRRCSDDQRQISRWQKFAGPKGRFRSNICNKCLAAGGKNSIKISPVIRQGLLHWGLELTDSIIEKHRIRVGK